MIAALNRLVDLVEERIGEELDVNQLAGAVGTTEHHLRRMFSSLAGMPFSEYVRRRRMTVAAADVVRGDEVLGIAVRYGYGSAEAFTRAFRAVHGVGPGVVRRDGGPLRAQSRLRFRLVVEGSEPMDTRIVERPAFRLVGHAIRVPLVHEGVNEDIQRHVTGLAAEEHVRLKGLSNTDPAGLLQVCDDLDPDRAEGSTLTYLHGVAVTADTETDLDTIDVPAGAWAVFRTRGPHPRALQDTWAATATDWFPSNPWRLRPGPEIVSIIDHDAGFTVATCELWVPVEPA